MKTLLCLLICFFAASFVGAQPCPDLSLNSPMANQLSCTKVTDAKELEAAPMGHLTSNNPSDWNYCYFFGFDFPVENNKMSLKDFLQMRDISVKGERKTNGSCQYTRLDNYSIITVNVK